MCSHACERNQKSERDREQWLQVGEWTLGIVMRPQCASSVPRYAVSVPCCAPPVRHKLEDVIVVLEHVKTAHVKTPHIRDARV